MKLAALAKKYLLTFLGMVLGGYLLLVLVYALPVKTIFKNVAEAATVFTYEGPYRQLALGGGSKGNDQFMDSMRKSGNTTQDNYTDAIMLLNAENESGENIFVASLNVAHPDTGAGLPTDTLIALHTGQDQEFHAVPYARYWHGYLVYLKPLLLFFNYQQIRYLLGFLQLGLVILAAWLLTAKGKGVFCIPLLMTYYFLNPAVCSLSLQYTPVLLITLAELAVILLRLEKYEDGKQLWVFHFFITGCLTSYFDFLTYPVVSLGVPLVFLLSQDKDGWKSGFKSLIFCCLSWGIGYLGMWTAKWALATLVTGNNVFADGLNNVLIRAGSAAEDAGVVSTSRFDAIRLNLSANKFSLVLTIAAFFLCIAYGLHKKTAAFTAHSIPIACAALLPFAWYIVTANHSYVHCWMTYRALAVFVFALMTIGASLLEKPSLPRR